MFIGTSRRKIIRKFSKAAGTYLTKPDTTASDGTAGTGNLEP